MRPPCYDCARKHLAQALVLMCEAEKGYPVHGWLAVGHMAEAEDEALRLGGSLSEAIRTERLLYIDFLNGGSAYSGNLLDLIQMITDAASAQTAQLVLGPTVEIAE